MIPTLRGHFMKLLGSGILRNLSFCSLEDYLYIGLTPLW